jgi:hypothetical protein
MQWAAGPFLQRSGTCMNRRDGRERADSQLAENVVDSVDRVDQVDAVDRITSR